MQTFIFTLIIIIFCKALKPAFSPCNKDIENYGVKNAANLLRLFYNTKQVSPICGIRHGAGNVISLIPFVFKAGEMAGSLNLHSRNFFLQTEGRSGKYPSWIIQHIILLPPTKLSPG